MADARNYAVVTAAYWGFTLTDGALRMLVLLHFHALGYAPLDLAYLFLLYEAMGVLTNFFGGWIAAHFGLRFTLFAGLAIQIMALAMLAALPPSLTLALSVAYVMTAQALSGVAKDLTKMSSKSAVRLLVPGGEHGLLFRWVSLLTGSKNALKGVGFFLGGFLLSTLGFMGALLSMAGALALILIMAASTLRTELGKAKTKVTPKELFSKSREINYLSAARIFLFASRDVWFVVGLPVFLASVANWNFTEIGGFMAVWVIGYGVVQAFAPKLLRGARSPIGASSAARTWGFVLALIPATIGLGLSEGGRAAFGGIDPTLWVIGGLVAFGMVFALNSALHSYLIVAFAGDDKVSLTVGFYYMANAVGRLLGTLLSGLVYQEAGLVACLIGSSLLVAMAVALTAPLSRSHAAKAPE